MDNEVMIRLGLIMAFVLFVVVPSLVLFSMVYIRLFDRFTRWSSPFDMRMSMMKRINPNAKESDYVGGFATMFWRARAREKAEESAGKPENVTSLPATYTVPAKIRKGVNARNARRDDSGE